MMVNKSKAKEAFHQLISAAVSHELRNPLSSMLAQLWAIEQTKGDSAINFKLLD